MVVKRQLSFEALHALNKGWKEAMFPQGSGTAGRGSGETHIRDMWRPPPNFREILAGTAGRDSHTNFKNIKNMKNINPNNNKHSSFWNLQSCNVNAKFKVQTHYSIHQDYHYINNNL